ncbi:MAG: hypothetical protein OXF79_00600 [Chloroflexi bacterium]|nr:hypothetical protein [Chloroflexota bacterium]
MSTSDNTAQTAMEWIFVARSLARATSDHQQALRCMARAGLRATSVQDWIVTAAAWEADFGDPDIARECLGKAELVAEETGEGWEDIANAWANMDNLGRVVEIFRDVLPPRPWPRLHELEREGPLPLGTSVLDWIEPGESALASRQAVESADSAMENGGAVETIRYLIDAESMAESTRDYVRIADRWRQRFPELEEFEKTIVRAEEAVDTPSDWVWIALKWKNDFQNYDEAVSCMRVINSGTEEDWEYVLGVWKNDFNDPDNFRSALTKACGDDIRFNDLMSMVVENLDAYDLIEKASLVDLGRLTDRTVAHVATWDEGFRSTRGGGSLAGHYRFSLDQTGNVAIELTSDVDHYLYLIQSEGPGGNAIAMEQDEADFGEAAFSQISLNLDAGHYVVEAVADQVPDSGHVQGYGIFHLQIYLHD